MSVEEFAYAGLEVRGILDHAGAEGDVDHRVGDGPVPGALKEEAREELAPSQEGLAQGVEEEAFSEAPRAGEEEVASAFVKKLSDERGLVNIVEIVLADLLKALDADGKLFHALIMPSLAHQC